MPCIVFRAQDGGYLNLPSDFDRSSIRGGASSRSDEARMRDLERLPIGCSAARDAANT